MHVSTEEARLGVPALYSRAAVCMTRLGDAPGKALIAFGSRIFRPIAHFQFPSIRPPGIGLPAKRDCPPKNPQNRDGKRFKLRKNSLEYDRCFLEFGHGRLPSLMEVSHVHDQSELDRPGPGRERLVFGARALNALAPI
jgi:hypothetical protein